MTVEEKLKKCKEFIEKISKMDVPVTLIEDYISFSGYCEECGSDDVDVDIYGDDTKIIDPKYIEDLKDQAWHLLVDITD